MYDLIIIFSFRLFILKRDVLYIGEKSIGAWLTNDKPVCDDLHQKYIQSEYRLEWNKEFCKHQPESCIHCYRL